MPKISFFTDGHNGDMFTPKEFVRQIYNELNVDFEIDYYHNNNHKTVSDIKIPYAGTATKLSKFKRFIIKEDCMFINTWNGVYNEYFNPGSPPYFNYGGTNIPSLIDSWNFIFQNINNHFGTNLSITKLEDYFPKIDYNFYNIKNVDSFIKNNRKNMHLFCNGKVRSKQSFKDDMGDVIYNLAQKYPTNIFICTQKLKKNYSAKNIISTDEIIKDTSGCDLNEIAYLSNFCKTIVGKNSGPFVFCCNRDNFFNKDKTIISFNKGSHDPKYQADSGVDSIGYGCKFPAKYIFSNNFEKDNILETIEKEIKKWK